MKFINLLYFIQELIVLGRILNDVLCIDSCVEKLNSRFIFIETLTLIRRMIKSLRNFVESF